MYDNLFSVLYKKGKIVWVFGKYVPDILETYCFFFQNSRFPRPRPRPCHGRGVLFASLSPLSITGHVGFVVKREALGEIYLRVLLFCPLPIFPPMLSYSYFISHRLHIITSLNKIFLFFCLVKIQNYKCVMNIYKCRVCNCCYVF
jgi:hypothetical protein